MRNSPSTLKRILFSTVLTACGCNTLPVGTHIPIQPSSGDLTMFLPQEDPADISDREVKNKTFYPTNSGFTSFVVANEAPSAITSPTILQVGRSDWDNVGSEVLDDYADNVIERTAFLEFPQLKGIKDYNVTSLKLIIPLASGVIQDTGDFLTRIQPLANAFDEASLTSNNSPSGYIVLDGAETRWLDWLGDGTGNNYPKSLFIRSQKTGEMVFDLTNLIYEKGGVATRLTKDLGNVEGFALEGRTFYRPEDYGQNITRENFRTFSRPGARLEVKYQNFQEL